MTDSNPATPPGGDLSYSYRPSLLGAPWSFRLTSGAILSEKGRHSIGTPYDSVTRVRMSFRPVTMQSQRFLTEIWAKGSPKLTLTSASWKSMVEQERLDQPYIAFVRALHKRIAATGAPVRYEAGLNPPLYWISVAVSAATALGLAALTLRAIQLQSWVAAAMVGVFLALFTWQVGNYLRRNRPGQYRPDALPANLLPRS